MFDRGELPRLIAPQKGQVSVQALVLAGPRRAGKGVLASVACPEAAVADLSAQAAQARVAMDPGGLLHSLGEGPRVLRDIQAAPGLLKALPDFLARVPAERRIVLTSAVRPDALGGVLADLPRLDVWPLAQSEIEGVTPGFIDACFRGRPDLLGLAAASPEDLRYRMLRGGFPEAVVAPGRSRQEALLKGLLAEMVQKDLVATGRVRRVPEAWALLRRVAGEVGTALNKALLAHAAGLDQVTTSAYLDRLEQVYLTVSVPAWEGEVGKKLAKAPKLYLSDPGFLQALLASEATGHGEHGAAGVEASSLAENFVAMELLKTAPWAVFSPRLSTFRTQDKVEVDFLLEARDGALVGVDCSWRPVADLRHHRGLAMLRDRLQGRLRCGVVLTTGERIEPLGDRLWAVPYSALWAPIQVSL